MKLKWPTSIFEVFDKLVPRLSSCWEKMYTFLDPPRRKTTEHSWTKTILSREGMEWVSERHWQTSECPLSSWMLLIHEQKLPNHWWTCYHFHDTIGYLSNGMEWYRPPKNTLTVITALGACNSKTAGWFFYNCYQLLTSMIILKNTVGRIQSHLNFWKT